MKYIIGIDLGTTNSAVTYIDLDANKERSRPVIRHFEIPQLTGPGEISKAKVLPSFLYLPGNHEFPDDALALPWNDANKESFAGILAREMGAKSPKRMISSAKSWLCHEKVDRHAPILPWGEDDPGEKRSPIIVTSAYLKHIKNAWNHHLGEDESTLLENQSVVITVPASFDEVARDLTVEAAADAGIPNITLLEEPLAAFYSWLDVHEQKWDQQVAPGELILICDVGGGTTDFTLITLREKDGNPVFERIAVGDHLILGGDNMDLALAHLSENRLQGEKKKKLSMGRWQSLCNQCRQAKEDILGELEDEKTITLIGEGRKLIADTKTTKLTGSDMETVILEGFFPLVTPEESLNLKPRQGMTEFGLPYAQDPAITRYLIRFLEQHREDLKETLNRDSIEPDLIMFNGAALKPAILQERIRAAISTRFHKTEDFPPRVLQNPDLDIAVALGASYYGRVRKGFGVQVDSGSARGYYLGVHLSGKTALDEKTDHHEPETAICLVERGMLEGTQNELHDKQFSVLANQPVRFHLYSSSFRSGDAVGDVIPIDETLTTLPPLHTVIKFGKKTKGGLSIPVKVEAHYTEMGTLALWCQSLKSPHRWRFQFQLRTMDQPSDVSDREVFEESLVNESILKIRETFSGKTAKTQPARLIKDITKTVNAGKEKWPLEFIRRMADELMVLASSRTLGIEHESRWLNLIGFCLRPGFGDALDEHRIERLWKSFHDGPFNTKNVQVRSEWWVLWRRIAGGLSASQQRQIFLTISTLVKPGKGGKKPNLAPQEEMELWMTLANLERLSIEDKAARGKQLIKNLHPKKSRPQHWWALSRIGAREPLYGPIDRVLSPGLVTAWIKTILFQNWKNPKPVGMALSQIARLTGDRKRDLDPEVIKDIIDWLSPHEWADSHIHVLKEVVPLAHREETQMFGESLPSGIHLRVE
ncbi:MAG: hsp70 family protein [Deltaproteobacteria bacterium]|nr:hsp70 family protein [Deltaproteobacteria bacterium]